ncbi:MAG TPA: hypothetical protein VGA55_03915 [Bacteroidota bacterium]
MHQLSMETFLGAGQDPESNQYRVLQGLKALTGEFSQNRLYPTLSELIDLLNSLTSLIQEAASLDQQIPKQLKQVDMKNKRLHYEPPDLNRSDVQHVIELIRWAMPLIQKAIEEGTEIYDFVDENISVEEVGILPMYREEGYYFVPEHSQALLHLLRYEASLYTSGSERFRTLKTNIVDTVPQGPVHASPETLKLELIGRIKDLPNPATFLCETSLEFPFHATILPVAKRKLMARVFS